MSRQEKDAAIFSMAENLLTVIPHAAEHHGLPVFNVGEALSIVIAQLYINYVKDMPRDAVHRSFDKFTELMKENYDANVKPTKSTRIR